MKRKSLIILLITVVLLSLCACGKSSFIFTTVGDNTKIEANAKDGATGETTYFTVGINRKVEVINSLSKGALKIDFRSVLVSYSDPDAASPDVTPFDVVASVTTSSNSTITVDLPSDEYIMEVTAIGETKGTVQVNVVKP